MRRQPRRRLHWLYLDLLLAPSGRPSCPLPPAPVVLPNAPLLPETSRTRTQTSSNEIIFSPRCLPAGSHTRGKAVQFSYLEMLLVDEYHGITLGSRTSSHLHISSQEVLMNRAGKKNVLAKKPFCHLLECCSALIVNKETSKRSHFSSSSQKC